MEKLHLRVHIILTSPFTSATFKGWPTNHHVAWGVALRVCSPVRTYSNAYALGWQS